MPTPELPPPPTPAPEGVVAAPLPPGAAAEERVPLPPRLPGPAAAGPRRQRGVFLDLLLAAAVVVLAFLAAAFAVRNGDFWLHAAAGRLLAQGRYHFGTDPFAHTSGGAYWANHSWLFDLIVYLLYDKMGGAAVVVVKALAVAALAVVLLPVRRPGSGRALPAALTALAVLAISPRLLAQPALVSFLFLGVTLWVLWRPHAAEEESAGRLSFREEARRYGPLLVLFVLWVNLDGWFLLGPVLVALFWLGERLQPLLPGGSRESPRPTPAWLLPASLAVCLLNPHHVHAFALPAELSPAVSAALGQDVRFYRQFASPWALGVRLRPVEAINLAEWSYFGLVALGLLSFALNFRSLSGWRLLAWLAFAALGAWQARLVPFFAVVAGPVTALNLQDFWARFTAADGGRALEIVGRVALLPGLIALAVVAWPGWLQGFHRDDRHVSLEVQPDPSLVRVAETLGRWRSEGRLADADRGFHFHPDVASYCAWFGPEEKGFLDYRLTLAPGAVEDFETVCRGLNPDLDRTGAGPPAGDWRRVLRERGVTYLVLYDPAPQMLYRATGKLGAAPEEWPLLAIGGQAVVYGWEDGRRAAGAGSFAGLRFDPERQAFGPAVQDVPPPAPAEGPGRGPRGRNVLDRFAGPPVPPTWESAAATLYLRRFADREEAERIPPEAGRSPALPLLAVRAARRAVAANPDDGQAWFRLGQAYSELYEKTGERTRTMFLPPLDMLRHVQLVTALTHALALNPDLEGAHSLLAFLFLRRNYLDAALEHRQAELRLARRNGPRPGEARAGHDRRVERLEKEVADLEKLVQDRQNQLIIRSQTRGSDPLVRARDAVGLGLAKYALDEVLLRSNVLLFGTLGAQLQLQLMLMLGRADEARDQLLDEGVITAKGRFGEFPLPAPTPAGVRLYRLPAYEWLRFCQAAATGDYDDAHEALRTILDQLAAGEVRFLAQMRRAVPLTVAAELGLRAHPAALVPREFARLERERATELLTELSFHRAARADLHTLAALLALEQGDPAAARPHLERAAALSRPGAGLGEESISRPLALAYLRRLRAARP